MRGYLERSVGKLKVVMLNNCGTEHDGTLVSALPDVK
jgi:hypothetical protein